MGRLRSQRPGLLAAARAGRMPAVPVRAAFGCPGPARTEEVPARLWLRWAGWNRGLLLLGGVALADDCTFVDPGRPLQDSNLFVFGQGHNPDPFR